MNRRHSPASLANVLDDHLHWLGEWQCALMYPDKIQETNPHGPDTLLRWLSEPDQEKLLTQPVVKRLQDLHDEIHDRAYELGKTPPRSRPPFEEYEELLRGFESFVGQVRRTEKLVETISKTGGLESGAAGKSMEVVLREVSELVARNEAKGIISTIALSCIDGYEEMKKSLGASAMDYIAAETAGRIGHNLRPFDDVFRLDNTFVIWFLQQAKVEDAVKAAERVCRKVSVLPVEFPDGREEMITISVSLVEVKYDIPVAALVDQAMKALHTSQATAVNQIVTVE